MAESDGAASDVHDGGIQLEPPQTRKGLRGERFVQLDEVQIFDRPTRTRERLLSCRDRTFAHQIGLDAHSGERHDTGERLELVNTHGRFAGDQNAARAIVQRRTVARGYRPALTEG